LCWNWNRRREEKTKMEQEDLKLLTDWFEENKDHKLNFLEKEAIKMAVRNASTVGDLLETALKLLKH
jgi:hypothetical protein